MLKSIIPLSIATTLSRLSGFARDYILTQIFLPGPLLDLFFVLFRFPQYTRRFFAEGSLSQALSPPLGQAFEQQDLQKAESLYAQTFWFILLSLGFFCASVVAFPALWVRLLAPGFQQSQQELLMAYLPLAATYALSLSLVSLYALVLQLHDSYWLNGVSPLLLNLALIISAVFFRNEGLFYLLSFMSGAGLAQVVLQAWQARPYLRQIIPSWPVWTKDFYDVLRHFVVLSPLALIILFNTLFDQYLLSFSSPGEMSLYYIAERIIDLPVGILGYSVYSVFAGHYLRQWKNNERRKNLESRVLSLVLVFVVPAVGAITLLAPQIMRLFVSLPSQQSDASIMLRLFSLNILPIVINKIFVIILNAQERRRVIVQAHLYGMFCNASLDMILFHLAQGAGIALSTALTLLLQLIVFERSYPLLRSYAQEHDVLKAFWKPALAMTIALGALSWGIDYILTYQLSPWFNISAVGVMAVAVGCIYLLSIWPFLRRMQEN